MHNSWHGKFLRSEHDRINKQRQSLEKKKQSAPRVGDVILDNALRLTVFSGFERLFTINQAYHSLKTRFYLPQSSAATLGELINSGLSTGYFRGAAINLLHFTGVYYNTLLWAQNQNLTQQIVYSSIFETFFYPLDTIKTLLYADTHGTYKGFLDCLGRTVATNGYSHLWSGLAFKLAYNAAFFFNLNSLYDGSNLQYISLPVWVLSYGLLSYKARLQVSNTPLSFQDGKSLFRSSFAAFRGVVPFVGLNLLLSYQFYGLYSQQAEERFNHGLDHQEEQYTNPAKYFKWEQRH